MKDEHAPVHQLDHAEPTVIHNQDEDMTVLARWLQRGMEQGARFWLLLGGAVVALVAIAAVASGLVAGKEPGGEAWVELTQAKSVDDRIKIAEAHPNTPVAGWAKLLSAQEEYAYGVDDLTTPGKKDTAGPRLKKALDLFRQVAKEAGKDSSQALGGLFGAARTLESRNELPEAIEQYKLVAERFPNSPEAKQSLAMIKALEDPLNQTFYKELYAYKPPAATNPVPGMGLGGLGGSGSFPSTLPNFNPGPASTTIPPNLTTPAGIDPPPPSTAPSPALEPPKAEVPKKDETLPTPTPGPPKAEAPKKDETPAPAPK